MGRGALATWAGCGLVLLGCGTEPEPIGPEGRLVGGVCQYPLSERGDADTTWDALRASGRVCRSWACGDGAEASVCTETEDPSGLWGERSCFGSDGLRVHVSRWEDTDTCCEGGCSTERAWGAWSVACDGEPLFAEGCFDRGPPTAWQAGGAPSGPRSPFARWEDVDLDGRCVLVRTCPVDGASSRVVSSFTTWASGTVSGWFWDVFDATGEKVGAASMEGGGESPVGRAFGLDEAATEALRTCLADGDPGKASAGCRTADL